MGNDRRTLLVLVVIFVALFGALIYQTGQLTDQQQNQPPPITTPQLSRVYPTLAATAITAVQLRNPATNESFTMARNEAGAWVAPGDDRRIDQSQAAAIPGTLALLPYRRTVTISEETDLTQFGFNPDGDFYIQFITDDGEEHIVAVGGPGRNDPIFYALIDERDELYVLDRAAIDFLAEYFFEPPFEE